MEINLKVIPKPQEGAKVVFIPNKNVFPVIKGNVPLEQGGETMQCGSCGLPLVINVKKGQVHNIVVKCPACGSYNEIE